MLSSTPATSLNVTPVPSSPTMRARLFPTVSTPCVGFIRRNMNIQKATSSSRGSSSESKKLQFPSFIPV